MSHYIEYWTEATFHVRIVGIVCVGYKIRGGEVYDNKYFSLIDTVEFYVL